MNKMEIPVWMLIPSIFLLTLIYFGLGSVGHWSYSETDFFIGNGLVSLGVGIFYLVGGSKWE